MGCIVYHGHRVDAVYVRPEGEAPVASDDGGVETDEAGPNERSQAQVTGPVFVSMEAPKLTRPQRGGRGIIQYATRDFADENGVSYEARRDIWA